MYSIAMPAARPINTTKANDRKNYLHLLSQNEIEEREWFLQILKENELLDLQYTKNWKKELKHFSKFIGSMILAFPAGLVMRKIVRRNKRLSFILQFPELQSVRNNIEKGSFAYDTLLFKQSALAVLQNKSHLANLVCLAILFGDEFIDGIATTAGKQIIRNILQDTTVNCNLQFKQHDDSRVELFYAFDIRQLIDAATLQTINEKYGISYHQFYDHLLFLLAEMNRHLNALNPSIKTEAATLICNVCNKCFDTYKTDIAKFRPNYRLKDLLDYLDTKDDDIINYLLTLRAVLLQKNSPAYTTSFKGWSTMVRSMQMYDDMEDAGTDYAYQMNFVCYFAFNFFSNEWQWLQHNAEKLAQEAPLQKHISVSLHMPASCIACKQYARYIVLNELNWVQKKITSYLWKKNWLGWGNRQFEQTKTNFSNNSKTENESIRDKVSVLQQSILSIKDASINIDLRYAHLLETAWIDGALKDNFFRFISKSDAYFLKHHYFDFPIYKKSILSQQWLMHLNIQSNSKV